MRYYRVLLSVVRSLGYEIATRFVPRRTSKVVPPNVVEEPSLVTPNYRFPKVESSEVSEPVLN